MKKYDVVIKSHPKDYYKLDLVVESLRHLNPLPDNIYILSPDGFYPKFTSFDSKIIYITDDQVEPFIDRSKLIHRPNWNWANLVSILQNFTKNDLYFDVQADNFFLKKIDLFDDSGNPKIFQSTFNKVNNEGHKQYFNFSEAVFDITKMNTGYSYIIEFLMYDKSKLKKLFEKYLNVEEFLEKCYSTVNQNSYPADQEIYGNFLEKYFYDSCNFVSDFPVTHIGSHEAPTRERLIEYIKYNESKNLHFACSYHTYM